MPPAEPKSRKLRRLFQAGSVIRIMGAHDGLGAKLIEKNRFDGVWASGLEVSTAHAVPDANILTMTENLDAAMAMNEAPNTQRNTSGPIMVVTQLPTAPAKPWLASVATRMPRTMGQGLRKRAAKTSDRSWVLSPISAKATMPVETRNASISIRCAVYKRTNLT